MGGKRSLKFIRLLRAGVQAARSGTEFTWSPQLRNLAEWDWVPIFLQNKYGGECRHGRTMSFCSLSSFPASKHQEKVFMNFFNGIFGHREAWCINSSWVTSLFVIRHLGKFSLIFISSVNFTSDQPAPSLIFFQLQPGIKTLFFVLNICYEHTTLAWVLQQSYVNVH